MMKKPSLYTLSNILSLLRAPLAFLFLINRVDVRITVLTVALLTDIVDGYLARLCKTETRLGAILDPLMDKFFVYFVIGCLLFDGGLLWWQATAMVSRDLAVASFGTFLFFRASLASYNFRSIIWGKITTGLQFSVLLTTILGISITAIPYALFIIFALFAFIELFLTLKTNTQNG